ncbi:flagellar export protein FliJ [Cupriavidus sp. USMAA2-4]|uniref:Flagellar FliJ protein n=1 Tax=Cupriavidus malaysiensis TaxID=367825 RepID=A0ABN4TSJ2_9BURK|nr:MULTISPECIES: flagellar export protein FliJ [Cupriavidus]AOY94729.1 flagellar export protein FliJ [Cupriavidus sp. USMAA2-4]AOZ02405.1 flagellar export protein FliJ [Cupriavidus sp. USMAHM13]AOZ10222.1 flagellar export protein FliJ [Cupriavidus malaysiensis]
MAKPTPLNLLADLAQNDTEAATRELGRLQGLRTQAEQQLAALNKYREEYRARMQAMAQDGMTATRWQDYAQFLTSLDGAIRQQGQALAQAEAALLTGRANWQSQKRRQNSFDTLVARAEAREQAAGARREQRANDEYAARLARAASHRQD